MTTKKSVLSLLFIFLTFTSALFAAEEKKDSDSRSAFEKFLTFPFETAQGTNQLLQKTVFNLGEVKVSGSRISSDKSDAAATRLPHNVTVIGEKEIASTGATSLPEVLKTKEGITYTDDIGMGLGARVDLRGFGGEGRQALVLFDGIRAVEPFDNSTTWNLYPMEYLKQVEVRRGGGSTVYGEGAFSGVIGLESKGPTEDFHLSTDNSIGDFQTVKNFVDSSFTVNGIGVYIGGRYADTEGYRQNGFHESASTSLKNTVNITDLVRVENAFYYADNTTGIPGPLTAAEVAQNRRQKDPDGQFGDHFRDELIQNGLKTIWFVERINVEVSNLLGYRHRRQDSRQSFGGFFGGTSVNQLGTETFSDVLQGSWSAENDFYKNRFTGGVEWSKDDIHNPFTFNSFAFGPFGSDRSLDRQMVGFFAQNHSTFGDKLIVEQGLRYDTIDWNIYDLLTPSLESHREADDWSPNLGVEYRLWEPLSVYANYAKSFKVPDANALIFATPNLFTPNPNVSPQNAHHYELGTRYAHPVFGSIRADVFYIETKKEILFNAISTLNENFDTKRDGFEIANEIAVAEGVNFIFNYTYTRAKFDNGAFDGRSVPLVPESRWSLGVVLGPWQGWSADLRGSWVEDEFALNDFRNRFPVEGYETVDFKIAYQKNNWQIYFKAANLLDEEYSTFVTSNGVNTVNFNPQPERLLEAGFKAEI